MKQYDPGSALTDYGDGMKFYKRIYEISDRLLNDNGIIILEFGSESQMNEIINYFKSYTYEVYSDLNGDLRILELIK